jgi:hypothetical protein
MACRRRRLRAFAACLLLATVSACVNSNPAPPETQNAASPQASAMPAPLSPSEGALAVETALRGDEVLPSDVPQPLLKDGALSFEASLRPLDPPPLSPGKPLDAQHGEALRRKTEARLEIELGTGRLRARLHGNGFLLPDGVELGARTDRLGYVVLYAGGARYRPLAPATLRSVFGEGRYDFVPFRPSRTQLGGSGFRLGMRTRNVEVQTDRGRINLELARPQEGLDSGALVCRMLLELVGAGPSPSPCSESEVPVRAEIHWNGKSGLLYEVSRVARRTDVSALAFACPPATAEASLLELPLADNRVLLTESELAQIQPVQDNPNAIAPGKDLVLINRTDLARTMWANGIPIAHVAAQRTLFIRGLAKGKYAFVWRSFLGDKVDGPAIQAVPGKVELGTAEPVR